MGLTNLYFICGQIVLLTWLAHTHTDRHTGTHTHRQTHTDTHNRTADQQLRYPYWQQFPSPERQRERKGEREKEVEKKTVSCRE